MATASTPGLVIDSPEQIRTDWLTRLGMLVDLVDRSAVAEGWATRRIEKLMEDSRIGEYRAPALLMQQGIVQLLLEPIGRSAPGFAGVVDLYRMPAYDDVTTLVYLDNRWVAPRVSTPPAPADQTAEASYEVVTTEVIRALLADQARGDS